MMKNRVKLNWITGYFLLSLIMFAFAACSGEDVSGDDGKGGHEPESPFQEVLVGDFETEKTSPYFFRYGNKGNAKDGYDYIPRWNYRYEVVGNPVSEAGNGSAHVLSYRSMEAQNYGIKILLSTPVSLGGLRSIDFKIYQSASVIGKPTWTGRPAAGRQKLCVKLLSEFNTINDFKQDEGLMLEEATLDFSKEGSWMDCRFAFNQEELSDWKKELFAGGIVGLAIMPTYGAGVTLAESSVYQCYIDDIRLNASGK